MDTGSLALQESLAQIARSPELLKSLTDADRALLGQALKVSNNRIRPCLADQIFPDQGPLRRELYPKHIEHFKAGKLFKARAFMAANRVGKSWAGAYETKVHSTGLYPHWWEGWTIDHPGEYLIAAKFTKTLKKVPQRALFGKAVRGPKGKFRMQGTGMIPADCIMNDTTIFMPNAQGTLGEIGIRYRDSKTEWSTLTFLSYEMGRGVFEGAEYDFGWLDEECDEEIFAEAMKRLMTTQGRMVLTWTPLDGLTNVVLQFLGADYKPPDAIEEDTDALVPPLAEDL